MKPCLPDTHLRYADHRETCPICRADLAGARQELQNIREAPEPRRTVWTWSVPYRFKGSAKHSDGGPYRDRETAVAAAHSARWELMDTHGAGNVGRYELQSHEAKVSQSTIEERFPERAEELRKKYPGLFTT